MIAARVAAPRPGAASLGRNLAGLRTTPLRFPSSLLVLRLELTQRHPITTPISHQCRFQGTVGKPQNNSSKSAKQSPPPLPPVSQLLLRSLLGGLRDLGNVFKSETLKDTYKKNPVELVLALSILAAMGVICIYTVYIYFTYFYGEHFTKYPDEVAAALRKALYFTNISPEPKRALKYYKQALELCDELHIDPFTDEVMGIKFQIAHWLEKINNQANAAQVLENLLVDCKRWVEVAEKAIQDGTVPKSLLPPSNLKDKEEDATSAQDVEPRGPETIWGKRNRILKKSVGISVKLGDLYNDEHVLQPDTAHERLMWAVETCLTELKRRTVEGVKPGEGDWLTAEELGGAYESLAHSYETKNQFELALPLFLQALTSCQEPCHSAVLMNNIATCFAQHTVVKPGVAAIDNVVMGKSGSSATPAERRASYLEAAQRWATNANQQATEAKGEQRTAECDTACAVSLCNLGDIASLTGNPAEARRRFEQAIALSKTLDFTPGVAQAEEGLQRLSEAGSS